MKKYILIFIGILALAIGVIGAILPILPSFPFFLLSGFCFSRSSKKLNTWFINTKLYKKNFEALVKGQGMSNKTKIKVIVFASITLGIGFFMMKDIIVGKIAIIIVWVVHIIGFMFFVKTKKY